MSGGDRDQGRGVTDLPVPQPPCLGHLAPGGDAEHRSRATIHVDEHAFDQKTSCETSAG